MRGTRIPTAKRVTNRYAPLDATDFTEANANNLMFLWDNMGTGEYLEDASILQRHLSPLMAREQASPNLTLSVAAGTGWFGTSNVIYAGGTSPTFTAPVSNPRIDILSLKSDGTLHRIAGTEAGSPTAPVVPSDEIPIAQVYNVVGQTKIRDNDSQEGGQGYIQYDVRPLFQLIQGNPNVKSIQTGNVTAAIVGNGGSGSQNATISSVNTAKSVVILTGTGGGIGSVGLSDFTLALTGATTVNLSGTSYGGTADFNLKCYFTVIEFY